VTEPRTLILDAPGATVAYDIRDAEDGTTEPPLLLIGLPMDASGFRTLAGHFSDRTVVTYDPRVTGRSERTGNDPVTPEVHADDVHRMISAMGGGPVDIFASSGGALTALTLVGRHPEQVRTLVAHEPPTVRVLPDSEAAMAATAKILAIYEGNGFGPAMAKFLALSSVRGPIPSDFADEPGPDPAAFGLPAEDDGSRADPLLANMVAVTHYELDFAALRATPTRIVIGAGAESEGEMAHRAALEVAKRLGTEAVIFPSHHGGFLGPESGYAGEPEAFAATLREVLADGAERDG
jgi:pimeloyl-ACP methyl ester carboxylesterase